MRAPSVVGLQTPLRGIAHATTPVLDPLGRRRLAV